MDKANKKPDFSRVVGGSRPSDSGEQDLGKTKVKDEQKKTGKNLREAEKAMARSAGPAATSFGERQVEFSDEPQKIVLTSQQKEARKFLHKEASMERPGGFDAEAAEKAIKEPDDLESSRDFSGTREKRKGSVKDTMERVPSGIPGMDELVEGGFEKASTIVVVGAAGTGKTIFGLQFLYNGAKEYKEPGLYITFEEPRSAILKHTMQFGFDFEELERKNLFRIMEFRPHQVEKLMKEGGGNIKDTIRGMGVKRLVVDSITAYGLLFKDDYERRENTLNFFDLLRKWGCTSVIISELPPKVAEVKEGSVGFLSDAIIALYYAKKDDASTRVHSLEILKMRGTRHTDKVLAMQFEDDGITVYSDVEVF